jgi:diacylglycerol kinase (ATP)
VNYLVITNPSAGRGRSTSVRFSDLGPVARTEGPGHAIELAAQARKDGVDVVVAAGGDGTVHEVVNGLLRDGPGPDVPALGVVPLGSGCDYAKTFDIPSDPDEAIASLVAAAFRDVDVGEITYTTDGGDEKRYFANIAEVGIGGECVERASRLPKVLGPAMYGIAFLLTLPVFKRRPSRISMDAASYEGPLTDLVVAIGKVFGGGMQVAPGADPADGLFDVQVHFAGKVAYLRGLPKVYKGTHLPHRQIREERARQVVVTCDPPTRIEADGEVLGRTPATFRLLPGALRIKA